MILVCQGHKDFAETRMAPLYWGYAEHVRVLYVQGDLGHFGIQSGQALLGSSTFGASTRGRGLDVIRLPASLPGGRFEAVAHLNRWAALRLLLKRLAAQGAGPTVLMVQRPYLLPQLNGLPASLKVYEITEDYGAQAHHDTHRRRILKAHKRLLRQADRVWATTGHLEAGVRDQRPDVVRTSLGVDFDAFARGLERPEPTALRRIPGPRIGLVGRLNDRIDWDLVERLVWVRPDWHLVVVGPIHRAGVATRDALGRLEGSPNFHLLPAVPHREMPAYLARLDVCLIPYRITQGTQGVHPNKLYEYLAAGRPVVSTPLPAVEEFGDVVRTAAADTFVEAIEQTLATGNDSIIAVGRERMRNLDWARIAEQRVERLRNEV